MANVHRQTWTWHFDHPPEAVWRFLADTARFNEAAKLPKHEIEEIPRDDGSVLFLGRARQGPFKLEWEDKPVNWITNKWFEHCRYFRKGPLKSLCATFELVPDGAGSKGNYTIEVAAANLVGELILRTSFFSSVDKSFGKLVDDTRRYLRGEAEMPFEYAAPETSPELKRRVENMVARIEESDCGHGLADRLADFVLTAQEVDLVHLRPLALAREWSADEDAVIELCLEATRVGLLSLRWDLLCPRCRIAKEAVATLDALPKGAHCGTCNIDYDRDFSKNVELSFQPSATVRPLEVGEYCLFGPMSTPHILVHLTLNAGEERSLSADLQPGPYRLRTLEPGPECVVDFAGGGFPSVKVYAGDVLAGSLGEPGMISLVNNDDRQHTIIVEDRRWLRDALTADRVTAMQTFRDLFSDQVLRPGDEVAIEHVSLMFTDLRDSTALYSRIGDASAYHMVRDHFSYLAGLVRLNHGAIVKTIGDAIMAAFAKPKDALAAALAVQEQVQAFNQSMEGEAVVIKVGLHEGPCIAVNLNDRMDYFGSTVNLAARLQGRSRGGDIVLSEAMANDPEVAEVLKSYSVEHLSADLKGFADPIGYYRIVP